MLFPRSPLNHFPQGWGRDCGEQASEGPQAQRRGRKASVYLCCAEGVGGQSASKKSSREPGCAHRRSTEQIPGGGVQGSLPLVGFPRGAQEDGPHWDECVDARGSNSSFGGQMHRWAWS